jgi:hypothetical protein
VPVISFWWQPPCRPHYSQLLTHTPQNSDRLSVGACQAGYVTKLRILWYMILYVPRRQYKTLLMEIIQYPCHQIYNTVSYTSQNLNPLNPLNAELNPICHLLALLESATTVDVNGFRVNHHFLLLITLYLHIIYTFYVIWLFLFFTAGIHFYHNLTRFLLLPSPNPTHYSPSFQMAFPLLDYAMRVIWKCIWINLFSINLSYFPPGSLNFLYNK